MSFVPFRLKFRQFDCVLSFDAIDRCVDSKAFECLYFFIHSWLTQDAALQVQRDQLREEVGSTGKAILSCIVTMFQSHNWRVQTDSAFQGAGNTCAAVCCSTLPDPGAETSNTDRSHL